MLTSQNSEDDYHNDNNDRDYKSTTVSPPEITAVNILTPENGLLTHDTQTPPFLLPGESGMSHRDFYILICPMEVIDDFLSLLLDLRDGRLGLDDKGVHLLHEQRKLLHLLLDPHDLSMAVPNGPESRLRLSLAAALHQSLRENLVVVGILDGLPNLRLIGIGTDDPVLPRQLFLHLPSEGGLDISELVDCLSDCSVDAAHLAYIPLLLGVGP